MDTNLKPSDELEQQLWELVYDLLPDEEADALRQQVAKDPIAARAYATVRLKADLLGDAACVVEPRIPLSVPAEPVEHPSAADGPVTPFQSTGRPWAKAVNFLAAMAASLLLVIVSYSLFAPALPMASHDSARVLESGGESVAHNAPALLGEEIETTLTRPAMLFRSIQNPVVIQTRSRSGQPAPSSLEYRVYDANDQVVLEDIGRTNQDGKWLLQLPGDRLAENARLEVGRVGAQTPPIRTELKVVASPRLTHLTVSKPIYGAGETLSFRSVTLSRYTLVADQEVDLDVAIEDASERPVMALEGQLKTRRGVATGAFMLPEDLAAGAYRLVATSPTDEFEESSKQFLVKEYTLPKFRKTLTFHKESYSPNELVKAKLKVERDAGGPAADVPLRFNAFFDGNSVAEGALETDAEGNVELEFQLPPARNSGEGVVTVTVGDGEERESLAKPIPITPSKIQVEFFPEGGELVEQIANRVYFVSRDPLDRPVHVEGQVVDEQGTEVAQIESLRHGRGHFELRPEPGRRYRLQLNAAGVEPEHAALPVPEPNRYLNILAEPGVFPAGADLAITLRSKLNSKSLLVAAYCRGATVGLQKIDPREWRSTDTIGFEHQLSLPLAAEASGVIRLTVFENNGAASEPIAERLVFRKATKRIALTLDSESDEYAAGSQVPLTFYARDESDQPVSAVLGLSVVDRSVVAMADDESPQMETYFFLTSSLDDSEDLEFSNASLEDTPEAATDLDLLLGTQGWRRFRPMNQLAEAELEPGDTLALRFDLFDVSTAPVVMEQRASVPTIVAKTARSVRPGRERIAARQLRTAVIALLGGLAVLVVIAGMAVVGVTRDSKAWVPALAMGVICLLVGVSTMDWGKTIEVASAPTAGAIQATSEAPSDADLADNEMALLEPQSEVELQAEAEEMPAYEGLADKVDAEIRQESNALQRTEPAKQAAKKIEDDRTGAAELAPAATPQPKQAPTSRAQLPAAPSNRGMQQELPVPQPVRTAESRVATETLDRKGSPPESLGRQRADNRWFLRELRRFTETSQVRDDQIRAWQPFLMTDDQGRASLDVPLLPDAREYELRVDAHGQGRLGALRKTLKGVKPTDD